jgi:hypothetical protein
MWSRATAAVIALSCAGAAPIVVSEAAAAPAAKAVTCVHTRIGGRKACLAINKPCAHRYERQYEKHGFTCVKKSRGRYRLAYAQQQQQG